MATKFVRSVEGCEPEGPESVSRSRVPPTICFTRPSCRSVHGRNLEWRRGVVDDDSVEEIAMMG